MERIIKQVPSVQAKKFEQDYQDTNIRFKKRKEKGLAISVEKIIERKRNQMKEVKSTLLPLISQTTKHRDTDIISSDFMGSRNHSRFPDTALTSDQLRNGRLGMSTDTGSSLSQVMQNKRSLAGTTMMNKSSEDKLNIEQPIGKKVVAIENTKIMEEEDELKDTLKNTSKQVKE